ncbi:transketolase C-terminal domain-containing protein [Clostridium magnum]|uniref:1-deoxy-D-xylulose-5-phosphate synthase n=1 Tax=Clostridium magnum DSM 2767 TaxID=1121326 RepID=A0A162R0K7_9CLOT|nr:transketolase C-terminal domain-containing protein [Clostridium magnum]KZL89243.1 1-deoxy-D-xylulose-5-phosphate synthase [Clostridium magnum DSM 2767]SHJ55573.1 Transketolase, C-terminal domain [Clostridium magnum DSM 2767]
MCDVIDNGRTRILNKGTDVAIITSSAKSPDAMKASRTLVVRGISTAIIEVLNIDFLDKDTILEYANKTGALVFIDREIYDKARMFINKDVAEIELVDEVTINNIIKIATMAMKNKITNHRGDNSIHYVR